MTFDTAAVRALFASAESIAMKTGVFRSVNTHEPKAAPGSGLRLGIWQQEVSPLAAASGLSATTAYVVLNARVYGNMLAKPEDEIDPRLMSALTVLIGAYSADFTLGGTIRNIDLLGAYGQQLRAVAGYQSIGGSMYRIATLTIPCVVNDAWAQIAGG